MIPTVEKFAADLFTRCSLTLQWSKSEVFAWKGDLPSNTPDGLTLAGLNVNGTFARGMMVYGIPVGEPAYVEHVLREKAEEVAGDAKLAVNTIGCNRQALWTAL